MARVEPEHSLEDATRLVETAEAPQAQPETAHALEKWPIVDQAPREWTLEVLAQRQFADPQPHLVMVCGATSGVCNLAAGELDTPVDAGWWTV